jgi:flavorubredoxin
LEAVRKVTDDIQVLPSYAELPGYGILPVNSFLLKAQEPVLVDTGMFVDSPEFIDNLRSAIDLEDLRWIWLTHPDLDHIGSIHAILEAAPHVKVITTFMGVGIMSLREPLPMDRVYLLNPGESMSLGDRQITAVKPPTFDSPATTGFFDDKSRAFFSSDCFGGLMQEPAEDAGDISEADLAEGQSFWAAADAPWLHKVDSSKFARELDTIREMAPEHILSSHLPPAAGSMTDRFLKTIAAAPERQPFVGPNQEALLQMLAGLTGAQPPA